MYRIFDAYAARWEVQPNTIQFLYKGELLKKEDTPESLKMTETVELIRVKSQNDVSMMC